MNTTIAEKAPPAVDMAQVAMESRGYWSTVAGRLRRDPVTLFFGFVLLVIICLAIFLSLIHISEPTRPY